MVEQRARTVVGMGVLAAVLVLASSSWAGSAPGDVSISDEEYVTVGPDGHLRLRGERVRFWGAIGSFPAGTGIQSGDSPDVRRQKTEKAMADNRLLAKRLKDLGFNMVRFWRGFNRPTDYTKGDGSDPDMVDYFLWCLKQEGIYVWCAGTNRCGKATAADVDIIDDPATADAWKDAMGEEGMGIRNTLARIWDPRLEAIGIKRMTAIADHTNHHTGFRWADDPVFAIWELSNEEWWFGKMVGGQWQNLPDFLKKELVSQWNAFLKEKYVTEEALRARWLGLLPGESLEDGSIILAPMRSAVDIDPQRKLLGVNQQEGVAQPYGREDFNGHRGSDVIEFFLQIWITHKQREADALKPLGKSLTQAPLCWDTGIGYEIQAQYLHQHADAVAHDTYVTGFHHDHTYQRFPWFSGLEELPRMCWDVPWIEHNVVEGKPYLVYETQIEQPAKYRAEYPMRMAALGSIQDWDAVCWHYYGSPPDSRADKPFEAAMDITISGGHPQGYHFQYDEVQLSAMKAAAEIFKNRLVAPAPNPTKFIYGRKSLLDPASMDYGMSYGKMGLQMLPTTYRYGVRIFIDPAREDDEVVGPTYKPRVYEPCPIKPNDQIEYDWQRGHLVFDAPGVASYTGFFAKHGGPVEFANGVVLRNVTVNNPEGIAYPVAEDEKYVEFTLASTDGLPLEACKTALISAVSTSFNSGFKVNEDAITEEFGWWFNEGAITADGRGGLPVLVARVGATVEAPAIDGMQYRMLDWHMNEVAAGTVENGILEIPADLPVFVVELKR